MTAESAEPPTDAELMKPNIALRFSSGKASIKAALKTLFPAQFKSPAKNPKMHIGRNLVEKYAVIRTRPESEKPRLITQNLALGDNLIAPSNNAATTYAAEYMAAR